MALFLVLALENSALAIEKSITEHFADEFYKIEDGKWFVSSPLVTPKQISDRLGITSVDDESKDELSGLIIPVRGYFGRGDLDMWDWLAAKMPKPNA